MDQLMVNLYLIFKWLFHLSCTASILILMIMLVKILLKNKLGVKFHYAIWFILILKLILPFAPESSMSLFNILPITTQTSTAPLFTNDFYTRTTYSSIVNENNPTNVVSPRSEENTTYSKSTIVNTLNNIKSYIKNISPYKWFFLVWMLGMLLLSIYTIIISIVFNNKVAQGKELSDKGILNILEECKNKMKLKKTIPVIELEGLCSPAILGFVNPKIIIPLGSTNTIDSNEFHYVFLHELCHYRRKDTIVNYLIRLLCILHWFNPLIWYAFYKMRQDRELCCDATTLSYLNPDDTKEYGHTIINLISNFQVLPRVAGISGMLENKSQIKRRITMIKSFKKDSYKLSIISVVVLLLFACVMLTDAKAVQNIKILSKSVVSDAGVTMKIDNIEYPFVNDPQILGNWEAVDFVKEISNFTADKKSFMGELSLKELNFLEKGKTFNSPFVWTKGIIIQPVDKTASEYVIKEINNSTYMFFQWKSGDYTFRDMTPSYYVLKKTNKDVPKEEDVKRRVDNIDLPFINDPSVIGKWNSVDFVNKISDFNPDTKNWQGDLYLEDLNFKKNGKMDHSWNKWTNGVVIHRGDKTASAYTLKEINGSTYMFFEWKSGDYIFRNMDPCYYVLKKAE
jgi:bla regulator protein BlaR1